MSESTTCFGNCFIAGKEIPSRAPQSWAPPLGGDYPDIVPAFPDNEFALTPKERHVGELLAQAWNAFAALDCKHPDDNNEFRNAIHDAQKLIGMRVARRVDKGYWLQPPQGK